MGRLHRGATSAGLRFLALVVALIILATYSSSSARAATPTGGADPADLAAALTDQSGILQGASYVSVPPNGTPNAVMSTPLAGFPTAGTTYTLLTNGDAALAGTGNTSTSSGSDDGGDAVRGDGSFDVTVLKVDINVPAGNNCLAGVDFRFLSEEYPEYVGSNFNDSFIAELDKSTWTTTGSTISAPDNFAFDPQHNPITVNAAGTTSMSADQAAGTTYDGATPILAAATPITPGAHSIYFSIFDTGDHVLDSAVLLDNLRLSHVADTTTQCVPGAAPVSSGTVETATRLPITDSTPLYDVPVRLGLSGVTCPASVNIQLDPSVQLSQGVSKTFDVCSSGQQPPTSLDIEMPVFDKNGSAAAPYKNVTLLAEIGNGPVLNTQVRMPPPPIWIGLGDSFSSGHHQDQDRPGCLAETSACKVFPNSPDFSWVTQAARRVNTQLKVPSTWTMTSSMEARSNASTNDVRTKQEPATRADLAGHIGTPNNSWDIVTFNGGADDGQKEGRYTFATALAYYYAAAQLQASSHFGAPLPPWSATHTSTPGCPNTNEVYNTARSLAEPHPVSAASNLGRNPKTATNIQWMVNDLIKYEPSLRFIVVGYPYVPTTSSCANDVQQRTLSRGACSATNMLDAPLLGGRGPDGIRYDGITSPLGASDVDRVLPLDLRPLDQTCNGSTGILRATSTDIQETRLYGYPHPTAAGQAKIADAAASSVLGFVDTPTP